MKKSIVLTFILLVVLSAHAQFTISPSTIASSGGFDSIPSLTLSYTIGEMAVVETGTSASLILTQGFQQSFPDPFGGVWISETTDAASPSFIHPNPAEDHINVTFLSKTELNIRLTIIDFLGQVFYSDEATFPSGPFTKRIDLKGLSAGLYLITLYPDHQHPAQSFKFTKN